MTRTSAPTDRVLPATRILSAVIVPFLVLAFLVLVPRPGDTKRLFAWQILPTISPMILGSVYIGGAYFFFRAVRAAQWHTVAGGFPSVGTFATLMGIGGEDDLRISPLAAGIIVAAGGLATLTSAFLYLFPHRAVALWPWRLTPLTAQMLGAIFALGIAGLGAARERRWSAMRTLFQVEAIMLVLILIAGVRARDQFDSSNVLTWLFAAGFVATALATAALYVRMEQRSRIEKPRASGRT